MKILTILMIDDSISVYKADTKEDLNKAAHDYISHLYKPEKFLEEEVYQAFKNNSDELYIELENSYLENADIKSLEIHTLG